MTAGMPVSPVPDKNSVAIQIIDLAIPQILKHEHIRPSWTAFPKTSTIFREVEIMAAMRAFMRLL
jgi:hypothetical protein